LKAKPFALIGVNVSGNGAESLRRVVNKEGLTWRSFADARGEIGRRWNLTGTPTLYVIDPKGVIRHKWVGAPGEKVIDAALDKLIRETEETGKEPLR
jgi:peroxiredoxin